MKCWLGQAALLLPLSAAVSLNNFLVNLPKVPKVQNAGQDGLPRLPKVGNILGDFSRAAKGLSFQTDALEREVRRVQQEDRDKIRKQRISYDEFLKKQERANQKIQADNADRARKITLVRKHTKQTLAAISKTDMDNMRQRDRLKSLEQQLERAHKAAESALDITDASKGAQRLRLQSLDADTTADDQDMSSDVLSGDATAGSPDDMEVEHLRGSLSFLQVEPDKASEAVEEDAEDDYELIDDKPETQKSGSNQVIKARKDPIATLEIHAKQDAPSGQAGEQVSQAGQAEEQISTEDSDNEPSALSGYDLKPMQVLAPPPTQSIAPAKSQKQTQKLRLSAARKISPSVPVAPNAQFFAHTLSPALKAAKELSDSPSAARKVSLSGPVAPSAVSSGQTDAPALKAAKELSDSPSPVRKISPSGPVAPNAMRPGPSDAPDPRALKELGDSPSAVGKISPSVPVAPNAMSSGHADAPALEAPKELSDSSGDNEGAPTALSKERNGALAFKSDMLNTAEEKTSALDADDQLQRLPQNALEDENLQQPVDAAEPLLPAESAPVEKMALEDSNSQLLHQHASTSTAEVMVASVSKGLRQLREEARRSMSVLKVRFQKAYKLGQRRHDVLIGQSRSLLKKLKMDMRRTHKAEAALVQVKATSSMLKHKIQSITVFMGSLRQAL